MNIKLFTANPLVRMLILSSFCATLSVATVFGQDTQNTKNTIDQTLRSSGRVNPSTLGMEFDLPLGSYPGRGISMPLGINYSSKQWRFEESETIHTPNNPKNVHALAKYSDNAAAGWTSSLSQPYIEYTGEFNRFDNYGRPLPGELSGGGSTSPPGDNYIRRITVFLPGGGSHELRASDAPVSNTNPGNAPPSSAWEGTFYSTDGSGMKYVQDSAASPHPVFRLFMPDGSYYDFNIDREDKSTTDFTQVRRGYRLTDVHGNYIQFNAPTTSLPNGSWTDQLGRTFPIMIPRETPALPEGKTVFEQAFSLPGMGAQYTLLWKPLLAESGAQTESALTDVRTQELHYAGTTSGGSNPTSYSPSLFTSGSRIRACTSSNSYFYIAVESPFNKFNPVVLTDIILPNGAKYTFTYNEYGEVERIYYPSGGREELNYGPVPSLAHMAGPYQQSNRGVTEHRIYESDGDETPNTWAFSAAASDNNYRTSVVAPDATRTDTFMHRGVPTPSCAQEGYSGYSENYYGTRWGYDNILSGVAYDTRVFSSTGHIMRRSLVRYGAYDTSIELRHAPSPTLYAQRNLRTLTTESITYDGDAGISAVTKVEYDTDLDEFGSPQNAIRTKEYAYVVVSGGNSISPGETPSSSPITLSDPTTSATLVRISEIDYLNTTTISGLSATKAAAAANNVLRLPIASRIKDANGITIVSQILTTYDTAGRGLPLSSSAWDSTKGAVTNSANYITSSATYDSYGNKITATDAKGNTTTTSYDSTYHAFPETVTSPVPDSSGTYGSSTAFTTSATFNTVTGQPLTSTDANGQVSEMTYDSDTGRLLSVELPNGHLTQYQYGAVDSSGRFEESERFTKIRTQIDSIHWKESIDWFDGLGRSIKTQSVETTGDVFTEVEFDQMGRVKRSANPYKEGETKKWTTPEYDDLSRTKRVISPDSNEVQFTYGISISGVVGITKTATDQAGKKRKGISDAQGNMLRIIEDPDGQNLATEYVFDTVGRLRKTTQGVQVRYFSYDSLGRLIRAKQVEQAVNSELALPAADPVTGNNSWTVGYAHDDNGNISSTTDAKNATITATHDRLNRLTFRDYSDSITPDVSFYYDGKGLGSAPNFSKGKMTKVTSTVSENRYTSFDNMGRLLTSQQLTTAEQRNATQDPYTFHYVYNLSGALIEQTYPSGRVVKNTLNADGGLSQMQTKKNAASGYWTVADSFTYDSAGAVTKMQIGNGHWENSVYNERGQVTRIGLGRLDNTQDLLKLEFKYNTGTSNDNNGSIREQKITVPTVGSNSGFTATQTYTYDSLNRIQSAAEVISSQTWKQTFSYDRYGNRRFDTTGSNTTTLGSCAQVICNPTISTSTNRINDSYYVYDANGNLTEDANAWEFAYDTENRQREIKNDEDTVVGEYFYDGEAKRVKKISATETTIFVYDASGTLAAEYSTALAETPQVSYLTTDHLGSPRVITDQNGAVTSRKDFGVFGDETVTSQRIAALGYNPPNVRKDYTGYEKDAESGLDYAQARYYNPQHGRFTSVDPLDGSAAMGNPQTFNRYSYVLNSPYKFVDPLGLLPANSAACGLSCANNYAMNSLKDGRTDGALTAAAASGQSWSLNVWEVSVTGYVLGQPNGTIVNDFLYGFSVLGTTPVGGGDPPPPPKDDPIPIILADAEPGTGEHNVGTNFKRAIATMSEQLKKLIVINPLYFGTVKSVEGFQGLLDMAAKYGATAIHLYTHGSADSLFLGDGAPNDRNSITATSVKKLVNNSPTLVQIVIHGCKAGASDNGIAAKLATQLRVTVRAATGGMTFSSDRNKATATGKQKHPNTGPTYMVHVGGAWRDFSP